MSYLDTNVRSESGSGSEAVYPVTSPVESPRSERIKHPPRAPSPELVPTKPKGRTLFLLTTVYDVLQKTMTTRMALTLSTLYSLLLFHAMSRGRNSRLGILRRYTIISMPISMDPSLEVASELVAYISSLYLGMGLIGFFTLLTNPSKIAQSYLYQSTHIKLKSSRRNVNMVLLGFTISHVFRASRALRTHLGLTGRRGTLSPWRIYKINLGEMVFLEGLLGFLGTWALTKDLIQKYRRVR